MKKNSIKNGAFIRTMALCFIFIVLSLIFIGIILFENRQKTEQKLIDNTKQIQVVATEKMNTSIQILKIMAKIIEGQEEYDTDNVKGILQSFNGNGLFEFFGYGNIDGSSYMLEVESDEYIDFDLSKYYFFEEAIAGETIVSGFIDDELFGNNVGYYVIPVKNEDEVVGFVYGIVTVEEFRDLSLSSVFAGTGFFCILDSDGNLTNKTLYTRTDLLTASNIEELAKFTNVERIEFYAALKSNDRSVVRFTGPFGSMIASIHPLGVNDWHVVGIVSESVISSNYDEIAIGTVVIVILACILLLYFIYQQACIMQDNKNTLETLAYVDELTGCSNYNKFKLEAVQYINKNSDSEFALWSLDLKDFKNINSVFGYEFGDIILKQISKIVQTHSVTENMNCRVTADRFIGLSMYENKNELEKLAKKLIEIVSNEEFGNYGTVHIDLSVGIYCITENSKNRINIQEIVDNTFMAMNAAKQNNGSQYKFFTDEIKNANSRELGLLSSYKNAMKNGEFTFYIQPKVDIQNKNAIVGGEVLARWTKDKHEIISPTEFIPLFEKKGIVVDVDRYIFEEVCRWYSGYLLRNNPPINIAINVSRLGIIQKDFVQWYSNIKKKYDIPNGLLELEITESIFLEDSFAFDKIVDALHKAGFICTIDDFGAGYSSLNILKNINFDIIKLDAFFFKKGNDINRDNVILATFLNMAKKLNIKTVAEAIESEEQVNFLREMGCNIIQGYVFSKPIEVNKFETVIKNHLI